MIRAACNRSGGKYVSSSHRGYICTLLGIRGLTILTLYVYTHRDVTGIIRVQKLEPTYLLEQFCAGLLVTMVLTGYF